MSHPDRDLDADGRTSPDPYTFGPGLFHMLGSGPGFPHEPPRRQAVDTAALGPRPWYGSRRILVGLALVAVTAVAWAVMALGRASHDSDVRTLGDFETFARIIQDPSHERHFASVVEIEAVVPFPILIPAAIEADSTMVTAYLRPPWRQDLDPAISTYLAIDFRSDRGSLLYVQYAGPMEVMDLFREPSGVYRPSSFDPTRTATVPRSTSTATLTELPARLDDPILVLQWSACGHGLALASLASEHAEDELVRIAESVPEQCN